MSQLSKVIISVFIWPVAELARLQSPNKLDPRPAKASPESIDPVTVRGRLSRHLGRNYSPARSLTHSLVAFWESWQTLGALWWTLVGCLGRGPILRMSDGGLFYRHGTRKSERFRLPSFLTSFFPSFCPHFTSFIHFHSTVPPPFSTLNLYLPLLHPFFPSVVLAFFP